MSEKYGVKSGYLRKRMSVAAVSSVALLASIAPSALAADCPKPENPHPTTRSAKERTKLAKRKVVRLARSILRGPMASKSGTTYSPDRSYVNQSIYFAANSNSAFPEEKGKYSYTLAGPTRPDGQLA